MIFSNSTEYAIRGLAELAGRSPSAYILLDRLVEGTDLPRDFLAKIFQKLVKGGILRSTKGRGGGFSLARPAHTITLLQIVQITENRGFASHEKCDEQRCCPQDGLYEPIRQQLNDYLTATTLADLAAYLQAKKS